MNEDIFPIERIWYFIAMLVYWRVPMFVGKKWKALVNEGKIFSK